MQNLNQRSTHRESCFRAPFLSYIFFPSLGHTPPIFCIQLQCGKGQGDSKSFWGGAASCSRNDQVCELPVELLAVWRSISGFPGALELGSLRVALEKEQEYQEEAAKLGWSDNCGHNCTTRFLPDPGSWRSHSRQTSNS